MLTEQRGSQREASWTAAVLCRFRKPDHSVGRRGSHEGTKPRREEKRETARITYPSKSSCLRVSPPSSCRLLSPVLLSPPCSLLYPLLFRAERANVQRPLFAVILSAARRACPESVEGTSHHAHRRSRLFTNRSFRRALNPRRSPKTLVRFFASPTPLRMTDVVGRPTFACHSSPHSCVPYSFIPSLCDSRRRRARAKHQGRDCVWDSLPGIGIRTKISAKICVICGQFFFSFLAFLALLARPFGYGCAALSSLWLIPPRCSCLRVGRAFSQSGRGLRALQDAVALAEFQRFRDSLDLTTHHP